MSTVHDHPSPPRPDDLQIAAAPLAWHGTSGGFGPPDGCYGRLCWLPVLGPSAWALWTVLAHHLDGHGGHVPVSTVSWSWLAASIGFGRLSRAERALDRLERFHLVDHHHDVRSIPLVCPPVSEHHLVDLANHARRFHHAVIDTFDHDDHHTLESLFPDTATAHREYRSTP